MTARTHDAIAFASLVMVATLMPPEKINVLTLFTSLVANVVGALLPDIDQATNRLWDMLPAGNEVGKNLRNLFLHHRTITHSLLGIFLVYKLFGWLLPLIFNSNYLNVSIITAALMIGYVSHLLADMLTKDGIPLLFPLQWKVGLPPIKSFRVATGSWVESYLVLPIVGLALLWFIWTHQREALHLFSTIRL